jgi:hypothetical protein
MLGWSQENIDYEFNARYDYAHEAYGVEARQLSESDADYYRDTPVLSEEEFAASMAALEAQLYPNGRKAIELDSGDISF